MINALVDAGVIMLLMHLLNEGESPPFGTAFLTTLSIGFGFLLCVNFLLPYLGLFVLLPMVAVAAIVLWITCDLSPRRAALLGAILLVYKIVFGLLFSLLLK